MTGLTESWIKYYISTRWERHTVWISVAADFLCSLTISLVSINLHQYGTTWEIRITATSNALVGLGQIIFWIIPRFFSLHQLFPWKYMASSYGLWCEKDIEWIDRNIMTTTPTQRMISIASQKRSYRWRHS